MSIATLKKKAAVKYGKLSSKRPGGFSLNNPRRVESKSGRGRVQTQTPMKGPVPRGHGSCCGKYPVRINKTQYVNYDPFVRDFSNPDSNTGISVKGYSGGMSDRLRCTKGPYPNHVTKDMNQTDYETRLQRLSSLHSTQTVNKSYGQSDCVGNCDKRIITVVKDVNTLSSSEYLRTQYMNKNCLPTVFEKAPQPVPISGPCNTCDSCNTIGNNGLTKNASNQGNCA